MRWQQGVHHGDDFKCRKIQVVGLRYQDEGFVSFKDLVTSSKVFIGLRKTLAFVQKRYLNSVPLKYACSARTHCQNTRKHA